jgi:hypothetical protein
MTCKTVKVEKSIFPTIMVHFLLWYPRCGLSHRVWPFSKLYPAVGMTFRPLSLSLSLSQSCCGRGWHGNQPVWRLRPEKRQTAPATLWHLAVLFCPVLSFVLLISSKQTCDAQSHLWWARHIAGVRWAKHGWEGKLAGTSDILAIFFRGFSQFLHVKAGVVPQLDHHRFLPNPFQLITLISLTFSVNLNRGSQIQSNDFD